MSYTIPGYVVKFHITLLPCDGMNVRVPGDVFGKNPYFIVTMRRNEC